MVAMGPKAALPRATALRLPVPNSLAFPSSRRRCARSNMGSLLRTGGAIIAMMTLAGVLCADILMSLPAVAQRGANTYTPSTTVAGFVRGLSTVNVSGTIESGGTFVQILPSIIPNAGNVSTARQSLTMQNDNTNSDNCWVFIGPIASATEATSILLAPQQAYGRYWPNVPSDTISMTCASTSDTFYAPIINS
jgi:hypothetical protein